MNMTTFSDEQLESELRDSFIREREELIYQLLILAEMDRRKLYRHYSSLWKYVTQELGQDGGSAQRRITAARMLKHFPKLMGSLESGKLNLSLLELAETFFHTKRGKTLSLEQRWELLESLEGKSYLAAQRLLIALSPEKIKIPRDRVRVITEELSEVSFVAGEALLEKLQEIRGLLAHSHPQMSMAQLIDHLAQDYLKRYHPREKAQRRQTARDQETPSETAPAAEKAPALPASVVNPRKPSAWMIHELTRKQGYCCSYLDPITQKKCESTYGLEIDHIQPWAKDGKTTPENLRYLCQSHNLREAIVHFGVEKTQRP